MMLCGRMKEGRFHGQRVREVTCIGGNISFSTHQLRVPTPEQLEIIANSPLDQVLLNAKQFSLVFTGTKSQGLFEKQGEGYSMQQEVKQFARDPSHFNQSVWVKGHSFVQGPSLKYKWNKYGQG
mmetsp:Transcript_31618/g.48355  ORF Transcript_31618/g.48355 Transcript_31618/m.48355 type:complete len:124 (+) Transcript_31618:298-669(+)